MPTSSQKFLGVPISWALFDHPGGKAKAIRAFRESSQAKDMYVVSISADLSSSEMCTWRIHYATGREARRLQRKLRAGLGPIDRGLDSINRRFEKEAAE